MPLQHGRHSLGCTCEDLEVERIQFRSPVAAGCESLNATFSGGLAGVRGARYVVTLGFAATAGTLLPVSRQAGGAPPSVGPV